MWNLIVSPEAQKQISKLDKPVAKTVSKYLRELRQLDDPTARGKALAGTLSGLWRYRVGDLRIVCKLTHGKLEILALAVGRRDSIYH